MRVAALLWLILSLAMPGAAAMQDSHQSVGHAVPPNAEKFKKDETVGARSDRTAAPPAHRPVQIPKIRTHSTSGNSPHRNQPDSTKSPAIAKGGGLTPKEQNNRTAQVHSTAIAGATRASLNSALTTSPNNLRHRGPNAAVIAGSAKTSINNTAGINGTSMHRNP
jgi:hypothetical protein